MRLDAVLERSAHELQSSGVGSLALSCRLFVSRCVSTCGCAAVAVGVSGHLVLMLMHALLHRKGWLWLQPT